MHGGIGMTDEHDIGLYMKREAVLAELFGDAPLPPRPGGRAQRLLRSAIEQEIDPRAGDRLRRGPSARRMPRHWRCARRAARSSPSANVSASRPAAHVVDGDGDRLHRHPVVARSAGRSA